MSTKHTQLLSIQNSVEEIHKKNSPLIEREQIDNTPFWIIGNQEQGYNLIMGKWKLTTQPLKTKIAVEEWIIDNKWNLVLSMIICATEDIKNQRAHGDPLPPKEFPTEEP